MNNLNFGEEILKLLQLAKEHWYIALPFALIFAISVITYFNKASKRKVKIHRKKPNV